MDGLIIRLLEDKTCAPGRWFWKIFGPIRPDLDRMFWCLTNQPWMGFPADEGLDWLERSDRFESAHIEPFESACDTSVQLWRPGTLALYADKFAEEFIELWAMEPTVDEPTRLAAEFNDRTWAESEAFIRQHARIWLIYTDSTCWEIYARKEDLLDRVRAGLQGKSWATVHRSESDRRAQFLGDAGLSHF